MSQTITNVEQATNDEQTVELPRSVDNYELNTHAMQRLKDPERELNVDIITNTIKNGELKPAKGDRSKFELGVGPTTYTVIVSNKTNSRGIHTIITAYPDTNE